MPFKNTNEKKQVLFIHSAGAQGPHEGSSELVAHLQNELGEEYKLLYPIMPDPDNPSYTPWMLTLEKELAALNDELILIGHSLGGSVIMKYLSENEFKKQISALFLIAVPFWGKKDWEIEEYVLKKNFASKLPAIPNIFLYHSIHDPIVPYSHQGFYAEQFPNAIVRTLKGIRHSFGTGLPELAEDIRSIRVEHIK